MSDIMAEKDGREEAKDAYSNKGFSGNNKLFDSIRGSSNFVITGSTSTNVKNQTESGSVKLSLVWKGPQ